MNKYREAIILLDRIGHFYEDLDKLLDRLEVGTEKLDQAA